MITVLLQNTDSHHAFWGKILHEKLAFKWLSILLAQITTKQNKHTLQQWLSACDLNFMFVTCLSAEGYLRLQTLLLKGKRITDMLQSEWPTTKNLSKCQINSLIACFLSSLTYSKLLLLCLDCKFLDAARRVLLVQISMTTDDWSLWQTNYGWLKTTYHKSNYTDGKDLSPFITTSYWIKHRLFFSRWASAVSLSLPNFTRSH